MQPVNMSIIRSLYIENKFPHETMKIATNPIYIVFIDNLTGNEVVFTEK